MITFDRVVKRYAGTVAVDHLSLEIKSGETVMLVGPSGCGKTTSLKMINRLIEPTDGKMDGIVGTFERNGNWIVTGLEFALRCRV